MFMLTANEICDRFAGAGFHANMITYLTQVLNLPLVKASNTLTNFGGTSSFTPLIGAFIADSFAGRFWTIIIGSIIYLLVRPSSLQSIIQNKHTMKTTSFSFVCVLGNGCHHNISSPPTAPASTLPDSGELPGGLKHAAISSLHRPTADIVRHGWH